jgi:myo-inositol catabolism protein IolS
LERRICKSTGLSLPVLGIGCWAYGGGDYWGGQDQDDVNAVVDQALDLGINYFDTAEAYNNGRSEESLGIAIKRRRDEAIIGTKISPDNTAPATLHQHCEASLQRLQTDRIDLYMLHWPVTDRPIGEVMETMTLLQKEGKIRYIGLSNFGAQQLSAATETGVGVSSNQLCYNLLSRAIEAEIMPFCSRLGIGIQAYMPLLQGLLTGKFSSADEMPFSRTRTRHFRGDRPSSRHGESGAELETFLAVDGIRTITADLGIPMALLALAWILSRPEITCVINGIRSLPQLKEGLSGAGYTLTPETVEQLDLLTEPLYHLLGSSPDYYQASNSSRTY